MVDFPAFTESDRLRPDIFGPYPGRDATLSYAPAQPPARPDFREVEALGINTVTQGIHAVGDGGGFPPAPMIGRVAYEDVEDTSIGGNWFERVHILPRTTEDTPIDFGNILSTLEETFELFSAFRKATTSLTTFGNNAGTGVSIPDLPSLPYTQHPFTSILDPASIRLSPLPLKVEVTTAGPANFLASLDFTYNAPDTVMLWISGDRIALVTVDPVGDGSGSKGGGFDEILEFATNVQPATGGKEKRDSYRKNPRQLIRWRFSASELERQILQALLFDWHARVFALPIRWEQVKLTTAIVGGTTSTANVEDLTYVDLRVGQLAVIFEDGKTNDVIEVVSKTANSITFASTIQNSYPVGTAVMPVRLAHARPNIAGVRYPINLEEFEINFRVTDNDTGAPTGDTSAFNSYAGKVLLDDCNLMPSPTMRETFERRIFLIDNESGIVTQDQAWDREKRVHQKGFQIQTRQQLFELRRLLYALRGRQISFWIPSFAEDLTPSQTLASGVNTMDIENIGYTRFIKSRQPKATFRITFTDGTSLIRTITTSTELSADEERLTLDTTWPASRTVDEVERIEFYELVRFDTDALRFQHQTIIGRARLVAPVRTVFDNV